ncbi:MAG TPA: hypothetical protein VM008_21465 [Phycisphaerae bacterium]|nr:hypothetical protein [Phycisphaerae bacterium]
MKRLVFILVLGGAATPLLAAGNTPDRVAIPLSTGWVEGFLLLIVWLFVAAVVIGPLITFFHLEPRSSQHFIDDRKVRS